MRQIATLVVLGLAAAGVLVEAGGRALYSCAPQASNAGSAAKRPAPAALERACALILPGHGPLRVTSSLSQTHVRDGSLRRFWQVECIDTRGAEEASLTFDADSGALVGANRLQPRARRAAPVPLAPHEASRAARVWLHELGMTGDGGPWRNSARPMALLNAWSLELRSGRLRALVNLDSATGELLSARVYAAG